MAKVGIVMGSDSDLKVMSKAAEMLEELGIESVSYTHLDVYKRQGGRHCTSGCTSSCHLRLIPKLSEYHPDMQRTDCVQAGAAGRFSFYFPIIHQSHWRRSVCFSSVCSFQRGFINPAIYLICLSIFSFFEKFLCQVAVK